MRRTSRPTASSVLLLTVALTVGGCSGDGSAVRQETASASPGSPSGSGTATRSREATPGTVPRPRVAGSVATGLSVPWGLAFLPDDTAVVTERDSDRVVLVTAQGDVRPAGKVDGVDGVGEGGLLGVAVSPAYDDDSSIFVYYTAGDENVLDRIVLADGRLGDQTRVFDGIPAGPIHNGGRIAFGPDNLLYVATGDAGRSEQAQDPDALGGKILRITPAGEPAPDNPEEGSPVYSLGHRNVQGLAWDDEGRLWASEFGQNTWDELNRIEAGGNYGWPVVEGRADTDEFVNPQRQWRPDVASPSGIAVAGGSVFLAALRGERLWQVPIDGDGTRRPRALLTERFGRLRTVVTAPDGSLWVATSNRDGRGAPRDGDDRIVRVPLD